MEELLAKYGWGLECESPLEIRHSDGSFASGQAAHIIVMHYDAADDNQVAASNDPIWWDANQWPKVEKENCRSVDVLGVWPNGSMMVIYFNPLEFATMPWIDSEGGEPCITAPSHWCKLPVAP
jgi:hypothetical protein